MTAVNSPLPALPDNYVEAREDFHRIAYAAVAEARRLETDRFGLRAIDGGFGTPPFGPDDTKQVLVVGNQLIARAGGESRAVDITSIAAAAAHLGIEPGSSAAEHDSPEIGDPERALQTTVEAGTFLGAWFALGTDLLEAIRAEAATEDDVSIVQLWPGHFDPAIEAGDADAGSRATFGASPGDAANPEPYLYIGPWGSVDPNDPFWNASSFTGATLSYQELQSSGDTHRAGLHFFNKGRKLLLKAM